MPEGQRSAFSPVSAERALATDDSVYYIALQCPAAVSMIRFADKRRVPEISVSVDIQIERWPIERLIPQGRQPANAQPCAGRHHSKGRTVLTRSLYWFQHEPCWFVRKKNAPWYGKAGENSTVWDSPSPKFIMGGSDEEKFDHPTQKPMEVMRRPILNHTLPGESCYDPFLGSGTTLIAAEQTGRVCYGVEL